MKEAGNEDPGTPIADTTSTDPGAVVSGTVGDSGSVTGDDVDNGAVLTYSAPTNGTYGTFSINSSTGAWTYTLDNNLADELDEGDTYQEIFTVTVSDGEGGEDTADVVIDVAGTNDSPVISVGSASGDVDEDGTLEVSGQLTSSDVDADATATWSVSPNSPSGAVGTYGSISVDQTGEWTYTLNNGAANVQALAEGESYDEVFTIRVTDDKGAWDDQEVVITVTGTNDTPTLTGDATETVNEAGLPVVGSGVSDTTITVTGNISFNDVDGDALDLVVGDVNRGTLNPSAVNANTTILAVVTGDYGDITFYLDGSWSYTLDSNVDHDTDLTPYETFVIKVNDGLEDSPEATITINITDDGPIAEDNTQAMFESTSEDNPIISEFDDAGQFLSAGKFFSAGSGNAAVELNGDSDVGFLRTGNDSDTATNIVGFVNANTIGAAPNLLLSDFLTVANNNGAGPAINGNFSTGSAFFIKDPNNLASDYTFTLVEQSMIDNGGQATLTFDFKFLTNEGSWNNGWSSDENGGSASNDTLFMVLVHYADDGTFLSQEIIEITSVYDAVTLVGENYTGYAQLGNGSYDFETDSLEYTYTFSVADGDPGNYQLYFVILDDSNGSPRQSSALVIDNLAVNGGLETITDTQFITGNVITDSDVITGDTDVAGADDVARINTITVGGDVFTSNDDGTAWSLSTDDGGTSASFVSYASGILVITTDLGGTFEIVVDETGGHTLGDYEYIAPTNSGEAVDQIDYTLLDNDGTESTAKLTINIYDQDDYDAIVEGTSGNDILVGTDGDDLFIGGAGADTFDFNVAELGVPGDATADEINDFDAGEDVIDVADLISNGNTIEGLDVDGHLQIVVKDGADVVQTIDVNTVNIADYTDATDALNSLLGSGAIDDGI